MNFFELDEKVNETKIVDETGQPLVVYHGGPPKTSFDPEHGARRGGEYGIYFTPRKKYAEAFGNGVASPYYLKMSNPIFIENKDEISPRNLTREDCETLIKQGYDGIVDKKKSDPISRAFEIIAFRDDQVIKL